MQSFSTSKRHIVTQGLLLVSLIIFTAQPENIEAIVRLPILLLIDIIILVFFFSSFFRKIEIHENSISSKSLWRNSTVRVHELCYAQIISAFARWVVIFNDGNKTLVASSLCDGFQEMLEKAKEHLPEQEMANISKLTSKDINMKKNTYDAVMVMLTVIVTYGILRNL